MVYMAVGLERVIRILGYVWKHLVLSGESVLETLVDGYFDQVASRKFKGTSVILRVSFR